MKVPAVTIDVTDDGTAYTVTALPWPTIESSAQPFTARLGKAKWNDVRLAAFIKKLLATYPKVAT